MAIIKDDIKQETHRKQCSKCGRTSVSLRTKEPWVHLSNILWQEYGGMAICAKCLIGTRAA